MRKAAYSQSITRVPAKPARTGAILVVTIQITVSNPWLTVPLTDYERHMASPEVGQLRFLSDLFAESLECFHPRSVAVLGIAGGNGLDRIDPGVTQRIVGFD